MNSNKTKNKSDYFAVFMDSSQQRDSISKKSKPNLEDSILDALNNEDPDKSYRDMQKLMNGFLSSDRKMELDLEIMDDLLYQNVCEELNEVDRNIDETIQQLNDLSSCDELTWQQQLKKIKNVKRIISIVVDRYFASLKLQYDYIQQEIIQKQQEGLIKQLYDLKRDLKKYNQQDVEVAKGRIQNIKQEFHNFKKVIPKEVHLQINDKSLNIIKTEMQNLISLSFKGMYYQQIDPFSLIPDCMNHVRTKKKNQMLIKNNRQSNTKTLEYAEKMFTYSFDNKSFYVCDQNNPTQLDFLKWEQQELVLPRVTALIQLNQFLYLLGQGQFNFQTSSIEPSNRFYRFSIQKKEFEMLPQMPVHTLYGQTVAHQQYIYYWGGIIDVNGQKLNCKRGFRYDTIIGQWNQLPSMIYPRIYGQCCCLEQKIYLIGGIQNKYLGNSLIEIFDIELQQFIKSINLINYQSYQPNLYSHILPLNQNELLIIGGTNLYGNQTNIQLINTSILTVQKGQSELCKLNSYCSTIPLIVNKSIYLFSQENNKLQLIELNQDNYQLRKILLVQ